DRDGGTDFGPVLDQLLLLRSPLAVAGGGADYPGKLLAVLAPGAVRTLDPAIAVEQRVGLGHVPLPSGNVFVEVRRERTDERPVHRLADVAGQRSGKACHRRSCRSACRGRERGRRTQLLNGPRRSSGWEPSRPGRPARG